MIASLSLQAIAVVLIITTVSIFTRATGQLAFATDEMGGSTDGKSMSGVFFPLVALALLLGSAVPAVLRMRRSFDLPLLQTGNSNVPTHAAIAVHIFVAGLACVGYPNFFSYNITVFAVRERSWLWHVGRPRNGGPTRRGYMLAHLAVLVLALPSCVARQVVLWEVYDVDSDVLYIPAASLLFGSLVVDAVHMAVIGNCSNHLCIRGT